MCENCMSDRIEQELPEILCMSCFYHSPLDHCVVKNEDEPRYTECQDYQKRLTTADYMKAEKEQGQNG